MAVEHQLMSQYIYLSSAQQKLAIEREIGPMYFCPFPVPSLWSLILHRQYTLHMIQQPVRSRASGVGKKRMLPSQNQANILTFSQPSYNWYTCYVGPILTALDPIPIIGIETMDQFGRSAN